jgi:hypothetical protein
MSGAIIVDRDVAERKRLSKRAHAVQVSFIMLNLRELAGLVVPQRRSSWSVWILQPSSVRLLTW